MDVNNNKIIGWNFKYFDDKEFFDLFTKLKEEYSLNFLVNKFYLNNNTIIRWTNNKSVPRQYYFDLLYLTNNKKLMDKYIKITTARCKDQFYTKPETAKYCFEKLKLFLCRNDFDWKKYFFVEPSAGSGHFYNLLPKNRRIGIDIDSKFNAEFISMNFLDYDLSSVDKKTILIGNPPFGLRGNMALRFINHSRSADFIAMILPPLFESDGKGSPKKRVENHKLVYNERLPLNSYIYPDGKDVEVATLFQIWAKKTINIPELKQEYDTDHLVKIYSLSNGPSSSSKRNVKMIDKCDLYLPSTCFSGMKSYSSFYDLPNKRGYGIVITNKPLRRKILEHLKSVNWSKDYAFLSTNCALNLRKSLIQKSIFDGIRMKGIY